MSPSPRAAAVLAGLAALGLLVPITLVVLAALALAAAVVVDAAFVRGRVDVVRDVPAVLSRGVAAPLRAHTVTPVTGRVHLRQPVTPEIAIDPFDSADELAATVHPRRRGRHVLPPLSVRRTGPLGLGRWDHTAGAGAQIVVYPDMPGARRLVLAVRQGRFRDQGRITRGPLGLGTDFESVRDYSPDDDVRQINWRATARAERPMSNQFRVDQDRDVICAVDTGRLMSAPLPGPAPQASWPLHDRTRLDAAIDAAIAVALVADEVGDRCGCVAFDRTVRRRLAPRRRGGDAVVKALFDLEPEPVDADYELAFRAIGRGKRALVLILTDLVDEAAARGLIAAVPALARRHAVVLASAADPDLERAVTTAPVRTADVYEAAVAVDVLRMRERVARQLTRAGAVVIEARHDTLPSACVAAYLKLKARARI